jgi:shikimate dehydrogenase
MTSHYAVLGSPIAHSKSPIIHNAAFSFLGADSDYQAIELENGLAGWMAGLGGDWQGLSLTMPLKKEALGFGERVDYLAIEAQAANTLIRTETGWDAYNTDIFGIGQALADREFESVSVLGTGATARSAIIAMQQLDKEVSIWGRNEIAGVRMAKEFECAWVSLDKAVSADLTISTLPGGGLDHYLETLLPQGMLLDVAYDPWPSGAAKLWSLNHEVISGIEMLIWQAIGQQRLFAGNQLEEPLEKEHKLVEAIREALSMAK